MNTKLTLTAITLFAVTMGIGFLTPALAVPAPKVDICHYETVEDPETGEVVDAFWTIINVSSNAIGGHVSNHGDGTDTDFVINDSDGDDTNNTDDCTSRIPFQ